MAEPFHAFIQNLTVATTATTHGAAVVSLPRSQVEMTDWDMQWQDRITKVIRRVAKDLIANDEAEISEVVRRRLFGDAGARGLRRMAAGEPPAELPERFAHPAAGPGRHVSREDRRVRGPGRLRPRLRPAAGRRLRTDMVRRAGPGGRDRLRLRGVPVPQGQGGGARHHSLNDEATLAPPRSARSSLIVIGRRLVKQGACGPFRLPFLRERLRLPAGSTYPVTAVAGLPCIMGDGDERVDSVCVPFPRTAVRSQCA